MEKRIKHLYSLIPDCHHIQLIYTPGEKVGWQPWQVIAYWPDGSMIPYAMATTVDEAIENAINRESKNATGHIETNYV